MCFLDIIQEVCGLEWSSDGKYLASGGNDNVVNVYTGRETKPLYTFTDHQSAVKVRLSCLDLLNFLPQLFFVVLF